MGGQAQRPQADPAPATGCPLGSHLSGVLGCLARRGRHSEDDIHEYRIVRERSPVYRGLPFERVKLVSDTHSRFATAVLADA